VLSPASQQRLATIGNATGGREREVERSSALREPRSALITIPDWVQSRPYLSGCQYLGPLGNAAAPISVKPAAMLPLGSYPAAVQEILVVEDLLYCLMGLDGRYLRFRSPTHLDNNDPDESLTVASDQSFDISLADLANRITPLGIYYVRIMRFVDEQSRFRSGLVNHAFAAAVRRLVREYLVLLAQLENQYKSGGLTLQRLWFYVQPSVRVMEVLDRVCREATRTFATGGALLNLIHERGIKHAGDRLARDLFFHLMQQASVPYFEMLEHWIFAGEIKDPYGEFLIEEREDMRKEILNENVYDNYWHQRYTIRESMKAVFLGKVSDKILKAGKYLNVIRECGRFIPNPHQSKITYTHQEREFMEKIETAYTFSSRKLLDMLMDEEQLLARLKSIKHYFLLDQGDFINHFMDIAEEELAKNVHDISPQKLGSLLELALRTSIANNDPFKDDLMCDLEPYTLVKHIMGIVGVSDTKATELGKSTLSPAAASPARSAAASQTYGNLVGLDLFTLSYSVRWPLSLVISKKVLVKYQLIFRHLFHCKHVERQLCKTWQNHQSTKAFALRRSFVQSYALQQQMLHFLQNIQHYMMTEVLEPRWHSMEQKIHNVTSVDEVLQHHNEFLDACFKECMLRNPRLLKILTKLMSICITFSKHIEKVYQDFMTVFPPGRDASGKLLPLSSRFARCEEQLEIGTEHAKKVLDNKGFQGTITKLERTFNTHLQYLIKALKTFSQSECDPYLSNLSARLDYNGFYEQNLFAEQ